MHFEISHIDESNLIFIRRRLRPRFLIFGHQIDSPMFTDIIVAGGKRFVYRPVKQIYQNPVYVPKYENLLLARDIAKLHLDEDTADVRFVFRVENKRQQIPAHKSLLAARSDVFKAMFYGALKEDGDISIVDSSIAAFKEFLQFFYLTNVSLTMDNISDVVNLAKKYNVVDSALATCSLFLQDNVTEDNVCFVYNLAIFFDLGQLQERCEEVIVRCTNKVFSSTNLLECDRSILKRILQIDQFNCPEMNAFLACMNWMKAKTKQTNVTQETVRNYLGDVFNEIRFKSMSLEDFADLSLEYGQIFTLEEYRDIIHMIRSAEFQSTMFRNDKRQF